jgi:hypothetical protein
MDRVRGARQLKGTGLSAALTLSLSLALFASSARAGDKDGDGLVAMADALSVFLEGKNTDALAKLNEAVKACAGAACDPGTRAQLWSAIGVVQGAGNKDNEKAKQAFVNALREDPKVVPDRQFMTKELNKVFADAKAEVKKAGSGPQPTKALPTKAQLEAVAKAENELKQKDWSTCMATAIAALTESEFASGKLVLASCEDTGGLVLEATNDAKAAAKYATEELNADVEKRANELLKKLEADTPGIIVVIPGNIDEAELKVDGVVVPADKADKPIPHNPGKATIEVKGKRGSFPFAWKATEAVDRGEKITVNVEADPNKNNSALQACMSNARTARELNLCIETEGKGRGLTLRGGLEVASYNDTTNVDVLSPTLFFSAENPTSGWRAGATYTVDVVSTASPDIVATATRRFDEVRHAASLNGEYKIGVARVGLDGAFSAEPDYVSRGVGASVSADIVNKTVTPVFSYHLNLDTLGRSKTAFDVFSRPITTHAIDLGVSIVTSPATLVVLGATTEIEVGDTSKPYRHIPMFSADVATLVPHGASPELIGAYRLAPAPLEQLPTSRDRFALLGRLAHRFDKTTVRADERVYFDTWGMKATTTDLRLYRDLSSSLRAGPHLRFHLQSPVEFWKRAYVATPTASGWQLPQYRAGDRELGPLMGLTVGGGVRWAITDVVAIQTQIEGVYTQFLDHIYVVDRFGLFTATTLDFGVE